MSDDIKALSDLIFAEWFEQQPGETLEQAIERRMELHRKQRLEFIEAFRKEASE